MAITGQKIPLEWQLFDNADDKFPLAYVRDDAGEEIEGSPFALEHVADGFYANYDGEFPSGTDYLAIQLISYDNSGHTVVSQDQGSTAYFIEKTQSGGGGSTVPTASMVGVVDQVGPCGPGKIQDTIIRGEDRLLTVRLVRGDNGEPYDLTEADEVIARLFKEDESVLEVEGEIVTPEAGKISFLLPAADTADLLVQKPAPFAVKVTFGGDEVALCNFPYQFQVQDPAVPAAEV